MIDMMVGYEDPSNVLRFETGQYDLSLDAGTGVYEIGRSVDDKKARRLRPRRDRAWSTVRAEENQPDGRGRGTAGRSVCPSRVGG